VAKTLGETSPLHHVGDDGIDAEEHPYLVARVRRPETVELIDVLERLAVEGEHQRVCGILDVDRRLLGRFAMRSPGRTEDFAKLGPLRRGDAGAVIADDASPSGDERGEGGTHVRRVEDATDGVVKTT